MSWGQTAFYQVNVTDVSGAAVPNQTIFAYNASSPSIFSLGQTNSGGTLTFTDSTFSTYYLITYDCNGISYQDSLLSQPFFPSDTANFQIACASGIDCSMDVYSWVNSGNNVYIQDSNVAFVPGINYVYTFDMGDGTVQTQTASYINYTYASAGTYNWNLTRSIIDSATGLTLCDDFYSGTFVLGGGGGTPICNSEFIVDTNNSVLATAILWNTSTPAHNDPNYTTTYYWDFGDGYTSTQPFPIHTYTNIGFYQVCLTIYTTDGVDSCTSTYCDSLGMDINGNLIYKGATGFTLKVMDPNSISLEENELNNVVMMPNPANDWVTLSALTLEGSGTLNYTLLDLSGRILAEGNLQRQSDTRINISDFPNGLYMLSVGDGQQNKTMKLQIAH
ncbi:MAG: hypothetical protein SchgKO_25260 [Schleiferiaceae bacterium]